MCTWGKSSSRAGIECTGQAQWDDVQKERGKFYGGDNNEKGKSRGRFIYLFKKIFTLPFSPERGSKWLTKKKNTTIKISVVKI